MPDQKISDLQLLPQPITGDDMGILVHSGADYRFTFASLADYIARNITTGNSIHFVTSTPQNTLGKNQDVAINTAEGVFYRKITDTWVNAFTVPQNNNAAAGTILYGDGEPNYNNGQTNDAYFNIRNGSFYQKSTSGWQLTFSMLNGPAGGPGPRGESGPAGANGKTVLNGTIDPSNQAIGTDGDFYINTSTWKIFGPKTDSNWGDGKYMTQDIAELGDLNILQTSDKSTLVAAINEVLSGPPVPAWTVYGTIPFGKYSNGQVVPAAKSAFNQYKEAYTNASHPKYLNPIVTQNVTASITGTGTFQTTATIEVGQTLDFNINANINLGNSGGLVDGPTPKPLSITRKIGNSSASEISTTTPASDNALKITTEIITYTSTYNYKQGPVLNNDANVADPVGRVEADSKSFSTTITPRYKIFYGTLPNDVPLSSDLLRGVTGQASVVNSIWENGNLPIAINTGTTHRRFFVAVRSSLNRTLTMAKDVQNNGDVRSIYVYGKITMNIKDGGSGLVSYDVYIYQQAVAYSEPHTHELTI